MAVAAKGKGPASDAIMSADKMKPLLALSKQEPVQAAIGLTTDGEGLILLDKKMKPKKVFAQLRADAAKAKLQLNASSLRYGHAEVDTEYDSAMVRFFINKDAPGNMRARLVEVVKRIPYQKVEINVDPSLDQEPDDEVADGTTFSNGAPANGAPAGADGLAPPNGAAARPDAGGLASELAALARRIPEAAANAPALKIQLVKLATDAHAHIKTKSLDEAANHISELRMALGAAGGGPGAAPGRTEDTTATGGAMAGWQVARGAALASLKALEAAFRAMREPETDRAIILLRAIQANLTEAPATPAQVTELERYLRTDSIVQEAELPNGFGFRVALREPLLNALAALRPMPDAVGEQER